MENIISTRSRIILPGVQINADVDDFSFDENLSPRDTAKYNKLYTALMTISWIALILATIAIFLGIGALLKGPSDTPWDNAVTGDYENNATHMAMLPTHSSNLLLNVDWVHIKIPLVGENPNDCYDYDNTVYSLYSTIAATHKVSITSGNATFDKEGLYNTLMFDSMEGCFITFHIVDKDIIFIDEWNGVKVCNEDCTICDHPSRNIKAPWANVGALEVEMAIFISKNNIESGEITPTHNNHNLNGNSNPLAMTLPEDLTPYIGKTLKICSISGFNDTIVLEGGNKFDSNGYWGAIRFDGNGKSPCCVDFFIASANKIDWGHMTCASFCQDGDFLHCIDPERPYETNKFHGTWKATTRFDYNYAFGFVFDMTTVPFKTKFLFGSGDTLREPVTFTDVLLNSSLGRRPRSYYAHDNQIYAESLFFWVVQPYNPDLLIAHDRVGSSGLGHAGGYSRIKTLAYSQIVPAETGTLDGTPPSDNIKFLMSSTQDTVRGIDPSLNSALPQDGYIGYEAQKALIEEIISTGKIHNTLAHKIYVTQNSKYNLTRVVTSDFHHISTHSYVTVSGCTGDWAQFNGIHRAVKTEGYVGEINSNKRDYGPNPELRTVQNSVWLGYDSSSLTSDGDGIFGANTGPCTLTVSYGPITAASELIDVQNARAYWYEHTFQGGRTHSSTASYYTYLSGENIDNKFFAKPIETFAEVVLRGKVAGSVDLDVFNKQFSRVYNAASSMYHKFIERNDDGKTAFIDFNSRFDVDLTLENLDVFNRFHWDISKQNYLVDVKNLYYRCDQSSATTWHLYLGLFFYGDNVGGGYNCGSLKGVMVDYDSFPPDETHHLFNFNAPLNGASFLGQSYSSLDKTTLDTYRKKLFAARINPTYTGGKNIGYIRIEDTLQADYFNEVRQGTMKSPSPNGLRPGSEVFAKIWSVMMKYLVTDLGCESIIIDNRSNNGGFDTNTFRSFFGSDDQRVSFSLSSPPGAGYTPVTQDINKFVYATPLAQYYPGDNAVLESDLHREKFYVQPSQSIANYPDAVFTNGKVVILTDKDAASGGDILPGMFLGENFDRQLGSNTEVKIIGDIDGRLSGFSGFYIPQVSSVDNRIVVDGFNFPPTWGNNEQSATFLRADGSSWAKTHPALYPDCAPTLSGVSGGCPLPNDLETLLYPDFGFKTNTRLRLTGDTRPQTPSAPVDTTVDISLNNALPVMLNITVESDTMNGLSAGSIFEVRNLGTLGIVTSSDLLRTSNVVDTISFRSTGSTRGYFDEGYGIRGLGSPTLPNINFRIKVPSVNFDVTIVTGIPHGVTVGQPVGGLSEPIHVLLPKEIAFIPHSVINAAYTIVDILNPWEFIIQVPVSFTDISSTIPSKIANRSELRDAWLEESIRESLIGIPTKKKKMKHNEKRKEKVHIFKKTNIPNDIKKCSEGDILRHLQDVPKTLKIERTLLNGVENPLFKTQISDVLNAEIKNGGLCMHNNKIMVSSICKGLPFVANKHKNEIK